MCECSGRVVDDCAEVLLFFFLRLISCYFAFLENYFCVYYTSVLGKDTNHKKKDLYKQIFGYQRWYRWVSCMGVFAVSIGFIVFICILKDTKDTSKKKTKNEI